MNKFSRKMVSVLAGLILVPISVLATDTYQPQTANSVYDDFANVDLGYLGISSKFHLFTEETATLSTHTNGNLAVKSAIIGTNFGTNEKGEATQLGTEIHYIQNFTPNNAELKMVAESTTRQTKLVVGPDISVSKSDHIYLNGTRTPSIAGEHIFQEQTAGDYINLPQEFAVLREKAITLQGLESSNKDVVTVDFKDMNKKNINVASNVNSLVIVNIDYKELASNTPLYINNQSNQILLFNVVSMPEDGEASINSQINYNSRNNQETENFMDANILWNFGTTNATVVVNRPFQGTILAPNSNIIANQNIDGSIISKYVTINAESHRWDLNSFTITPNDEQNSTETTTSQSDEQGVIGGNASSNYDHNSTDDTIYLPQTGSATSSGLISLGAILSSLSGLFIFRRNRK